MITSDPLPDDFLDLVTFEFRAELIVLFTGVSFFFVVFHELIKMVILCSPCLKYTMEHFYKTASNAYLNKHTQTNLTISFLLTLLLWAYFIFSYSSSFSRGRITL